MSSTLYVSDLDGTLLLPDATIGASTAAVINRFVAEGGLFTYATARSFHSASQVTRGLELRLPVITYGGAIQVDPMSGVADDAVVMEGEVVAEILDVLAARGVQPIVFALVDGRDRVCWIGSSACSVSAGVADFLARRPGDPRLLPLPSCRAIDLGSVFYISAIHDERELLAEIQTGIDPVLRRRCQALLSEDTYAVGQFWLEFTDTNATKANAVRAVQAVAGADRLVCFGDNLNDVSMFAIADESYAVANAAAEVRAAATDVIGSNADEAVARWLDEQ